jgi:Xaa-Pro dipeptidase
MRAALRPGITEQALWSHLHQKNIELGGDFIETRLLSSGPRTNPWYQECADRKIEAGDIVSFDTDLIGPYGYCADISRSWVCGEGKPSDDQRRLYATAYAQIQRSIELSQPGVGLREFAENIGTLPEEYQPLRYARIAHGVGLCDEYPTAYWKEDFDEHGWDDVLKSNTTISVETYIGAVGGREGVKLEQQILITEQGPEPISTYPFEEDWL